jgi:hypothetical protein
VITEPETMIAIMKAIDSYVMAQRSAADAAGKRWLFVEKEGKRKIEDDIQDPVDAGVAAFMDSLARSGYAFIPAEGNDLYVLLDGKQA